jgi:hypothetical protein
MMRPIAQSSQGDPDSSQTTAEYAYDTFMIRARARG